ncbi:MAG TPA: sulfatase [Kofleriaceae bacterium]|nr:sulfatase [Kofleriaceae bacterium]
MSSRLPTRIARWLAPSAIAAVIGVFLAGVCEGALTARGPAELVATAGFGALVAIPLVFAASLIVRGVWAAWRPHTLAPTLIDERGASPRFAAWLIYLGISALFLSWATFNGLRWLSLITSFKPVVVSLAEPIIVILAAGAAAALSKPLVDAMAAGFARWERRRAAKSKPALVTPRKTFGALIAITALILIGSWRFSIRPRIGHFDLVIFVHPTVAIAAAAIAHALWRRRPRWHKPAAITAGACAAILLAGVAIARMTSPTLVLDVWSRPTIAGLAVDELFDLDDIRSEMANTAFKPAERTTQHPDVILVTIDTVRADRTPLSGGPAKMPVLAALGDRGAVFDWAFSPGNVTRRSIPSIVLGLSPTRVHGRVAGWSLRLDPRHVVLAERFRAAGYDTAAFVCCDSFWSPKHKLGINRGIDTLHIDPPGDKLARAAKQWIQDHDKQPNRKPIFVWVHFIEVHNWNGDSPDAKIDETKRHQYDTVLAQVDHFLGDVVAAFADRAPGAQPIFVVTADHGEGLGDHGTSYHSSDLYDSQTHVPLVITGPMIVARHLDEPVQLVDLAPTLLDLAGFVPPGMPEMDGASLAPLLTGARGPDPDGGYAFMAQVADRSVEQSERAIVVGHLKLIDDGDHLELYDLRIDPNELHDLSNERPTELVRMKKLLDARAATDDVSPFP